jgi:hypothetical protein
MTNEEHDAIDVVLKAILVGILTMFSVFTLAGIGFIIKLVFFNK